MTAVFASIDLRYETMAIASRNGGVIESSVSIWLPLILVRDAVAERKSSYFFLALTM
jgi:hypothetical protein